VSTGVLDERGSGDAAANKQHRPASVNIRTKHACRTLLPPRGTTGMSGRGSARTREKNKPRKPDGSGSGRSKRRNATAGRIVRCLQRGRNGETGAGNYGSHLLTSDSDSDSLSDSLSSLLVCIEHSRLGRLRTA
jgi:hypothetical protein